MQIFNSKSVILALSIFVSTQALAAKWDLSDSKPPEPDCLNCCVHPEFQNQCNLDAEQNYKRNFYRHRGIAAAFSATVGIGVIRALLRDFPAIFANAGVTTYAAALWFASYTISFNVANFYQLSKNLFESDEPQKPEGIILFVRAKDDWNSAIVGFDISDLKKKHLVLYSVADHVTDSSDAIRNVRSRFNLPIKAFMWTAHGGFSPGSFGEESKVFFGSDSASLSNIYRYKEVVSLLDPDTMIVVNSCMAAARENSEVISQGNIAQGLAFIAEGRKVYATAGLELPFFEIDPDLKQPRFRELLAFPTYFVEFLSGFSIDFEYQLDFTRCYYSPYDGVVERCPENV